MLIKKKTSVGTSYEEIPVKSLKNWERYCGKKKLIETRSSWEKAFISYLDGNPSIVKWSSEEIIIPYFNIIKNRKCRYFPDFYIEYNTPNGIKKAIIEIKPYHETIRPVVKESHSTKTNIYALNAFYTNQSKWKSARKICQDKGWNFFIVTEKHLCFAKK